MSSKRHMGTYCFFKSTWAHTYWIGEITRKYVKQETHGHLLLFPINMGADILDRGDNSLICQARDTWALIAFLINMGADILDRRDNS